MRTQLTTDNGLRTQAVFVTFAFTRFCLRVLASLNEIVRRLKLQRYFENRYNSLQRLPGRIVKQKTSLLMGREVFWQLQQLELFFKRGRTFFQFKNTVLIQHRFQPF